MTEFLFVVLPLILLGVFFIGAIYSLRRKLSYIWGFVICILGVSIYLIGNHLVGGFDGMGLSLLSTLPFTVGLFIIFFIWIGSRVKPDD